MPPARRSPQLELLSFALSTLSGIILLYAAFGFGRKLLHPQLTGKQPEAIKKLLKKLNRVPSAPLTSYEEMVAVQVVDPESIEVTYQDIGGQEELIQEIIKVTTLSLKSSEVSTKSRLLAPSKGILLYGPPGTGKTMLARAVAKESGFVFINLNFAVVMNKFVGESEKIISAVFSLATKLAPSVIFIDEIDCYFRRRSITDQEFSAQMKAQFMSLWDGFETNQNIIVMAASNRPDTIDTAILRRLPRKFEVGLPTQKQREAILGVILAHETLDADVDLKTLARETENFSGDDLKEMCKAAAMLALESRVAGEGSGTSDSSNKQPQAQKREVVMGTLKMQHFETARKTIIPTSNFVED